MAGPYALDEDFVRLIADLVRRDLRDNPDLTDGEPTPLIWPTPTHDAMPTTTIGSAADRGDDVATGDWDIYTADKNAKVFFLSGMGYDDTGDETVYVYFREMFIDHHGRITRISGSETRVAIDVPTLCVEE